jgi:hypothetical protein
MPAEGIYGFLENFFGVKNPVFGELRRKIKQSPFGMLKVAFRTA